MNELVGVGVMRCWYAIPHYVFGVMENALKYRYDSGSPMKYCAFEIYEGTIAVMSTVNMHM